MSKHSLMLSAATVALLAGQAFADTPVSTATTTALTTGAQWSTSSITGVGTANAGNIKVAVSPGAIAISTASVGAITVNTSNYVYSDGAITNNNAISASGILVDVFTNPNVSSTGTLASFDNAASTTITGAGIYMDAASTLYLTGSGTGKHGIWLDSTNGVGTYTGDITFYSGSSTVIVGDSSEGVLISDGAILKGDLSFGGSFTMSQTTDTSTTSSGLYGLRMLGQVQGDILLPSGGTITVIGAGATGMSIQGSGVTGSVSIGGSLVTGGFDYSSLMYSSSTTYPEGGTALVIAANVDDGIAILGKRYSTDSTSPASVSSVGTSPAIVISPTVNTIVTTPTSALTIGVYTPDTIDPGFSFYNRGTVSASPTNTNNSAMGMRIIGYSSTLSTNLTGGIFNSGSISASAGTSGTTASANSAIALYIDNYAVIGENLIVKNPYVSAINPGDQAALVNSSATGGGTISAAVSGTRGGTAAAIYIAANATVPSLINSGTISAAASTTDTTITNALQAIAIQDLSGTLTSIYNTGTISTSTTTLDSDTSNTRRTIAIDLSNGNLGTPSGSGVTIVNQSTSTSSATITGDIYFGTGDNQVLTINGTGPTHYASVTGNVSYGMGTSIGGNRLNIGAYGVLSGKVTSVAGSGVAVDVAQYGVLALENTTTPLYATDFHIENYGILSLGVSRSLTSSGVVAASTSATIDANANLGVAFNSFVQGSNDFVLITAPTTHLDVTDLATYDTTISTPKADGGSLPFLFASASLQCIGTSTGCTAPATPSATDKLVLHIVLKEVGTGANQLPLTGYASRIFPYANTALGTDDELGKYMVNGIANAREAQAAYNSFAPNVTGGTRAIAISITDQATGIVAARQRALRLYGKENGEQTLWAQEFVQMIKDPGQGAVGEDGSLAQNGFKDHGFGFAIGMDGGSPKYGWYGGAFTFYGGDVNEIGRNANVNEQWYLLSGYTAWRGRGLFFDSKIDVGYGNFKGKRYINLAIPRDTSPQTYAVYTREAESKHAGALLAGGFTAGAIFSYGATTLMPQLSVDGLVMRENGYTEFNPNTTTVGDGFDLKVEPYYAQSLRVFLGASVRYDINLWDFYLQPEARAGYRYDIFCDPVKLKAAFAYADTSGTAAVPGDQFIMQGPDPSQGNLVLGGSLAATTDTWTLGFNFDLVRGSNGIVEQVGMINILGRI